MHKTINVLSKIIKSIVQQLVNCSLIELKTKCLDYKSTFILNTFNFNLRLYFEMLSAF